MRAIIGLTVMVLAAVSSAQAGQGDEPKALQRLRALTPDAVRMQVAFEDDALETVATLSTEEVYREKRGLLRDVPSDAYLRAFVDKRTGAVEYQVYATARYTAALYNRWILANYETPAGPKSVKVDKLLRVRGRCGRYAGCDRLEIVGFTVDEAALRAAAAAYRPGEIAPWSFRLKARTGSDWTGRMAAAEIAGLLQAVARYRASLGLTAKPR